MSEMIERVAKAIKQSHEAVKGWSLDYDVTDIARAAIEAMREPTPEMDDLYPPFVNKREFLESWRAMIDAALR